MSGTDRKPLAGKRIVVTRAAHQSEALAVPLRAYGAEVIFLPVLELAPPHDPGPLANALRDLGAFDMMIVLSANGACAVRDAMAAENVALPEAGVPEVFAVGTSTASALRDAGFKVTTPAGVQSAIQLASALAGQVREKKVLLVHSELNDGELAAAQRASGAQVTAVDAYRMKIPEDADVNARCLLDRVDAVTFASGQSAANFYQVLERNGLALGPNVVLASIGQETTRAMQALVHPPHITAQETSAQSLADALAEFFRGTR